MGVKKTITPRRKCSICKSIIAKNEDTDTVSPLILSARASLVQKFEKLMYNKTIPLDLGAKLLTFIRVYSACMYTKILI